MAIRIFLAGAAGVVGRRLVPLLMADGHIVTGTTRHPDRAAELRAAGVAPVVVDVFSAEALAAAVAEAKPDVVIHQLTDLPSRLDPARMAEALQRNARIRDEGTRNLVAAAQAAGERRVIAQSIAFAYAPGPGPRSEEDPLDVDGARAVTVAGVVVLERAVLQSPPLEGIVLRYGRFYGPGTGVDAPPAAPGVHVDAAAEAARLAVKATALGIFNVAEPGSAVTSARAERELGWDSGFRLGRA